MNNEWEIFLSEIQLAARKNLEARIATGKVITRFRTSILRNIPMKNPETGQYTEQYAKALELENKIWHFCKNPTSANISEELKEELNQVMLFNRNEGE